MALQAPYLISAQVTSHDTVKLWWRNNSTDYTSINILRREQGTVSFAMIRTVSGTTQQYADGGLRPETKYYYALLAESQTEVSDTSNSDSATTLARPCYLYIPSVTIAWDTTTRVATVMYEDSSACQDGYRIKKSENFGPFVIAEELSPLPDGNTQGIWVDSSIHVNNWYTYVVEVYDSVKTEVSLPDTIFALERVALTKVGGEYVRVNEKLSEFPLSFSWWMYLTGDTLFLRENEINSPLNSYTVLYVGDPSATSFVEFRQLETEMMGFERYYNIGRKMIGSCSRSICSYEYTTTGFVKNFDSELGFIAGAGTYRESYEPGGFVGFLGDTHLLAVSFKYMWQPTPTTYAWTNHIEPISVTDSGAARPSPDYDPHDKNDRDNILGYYAGTAHSQTRDKMAFCWMPGNQYYDTSTIILDYTYSLTNPVKFNLTQNQGIVSVGTIPQMMDGLVVDNSVLLSCNHVVFDKERKLAFAVGNSLLEIYSYTTEVGVSNSWGIRPVLNGELRVHTSLLSSSVRFSVRGPNTDAWLYVYNARGRLVKAFASSSTGTYTWDTHNISGGLYVASFQGSSMVGYKRFMLTK